MKSFIINIINLIKKGMMYMSEIWSGVEVKSTSVLYAFAILEGIMTFNRVSKYFKADTAVVLVSLGAEELVTDETYLSKAKERIAAAEQQE